MTRLLIVCLASALIVQVARAADSPSAPADDAARKETEMAADNSFAADLYTRLASAPAGQANLFFSPYSIRTALAMTYAGARGQTASQMATVLHLQDMPSDQLHQSFASLIKQMNAGHEDYQLSVANALWGQSGY